MRVTCAQRFGPRSNLRSDPILAVFIHSLSRSPAKIGPEIRFSFRFALAAGMLFTKRNENRAWSPVILEGKSKSNENHRQTKCNIIWICMKIDIKLTSNKWTKTSKSYQKRVNFGFSTKQWPPIDPLAIVLDTKPHLHALKNWKKSAQHAKVLAPCWRF